jgi:gas vesicle protein
MSDNNNNGNNNHAKGKGLAVGAAIGAVAGVVTGILFAPKSGKETRQDIKDTAEKMKVKFEVEAKKLQLEIAEQIDKAEAMFKEKSNLATDKAKELVEKAKHEKDLLTALALSVKDGKADDKDLNKAIKKAKEAKDALATYLKK